MAVIHGEKRAGQFAKQNASKHFHRILMLCIMISIGVGTIFGMLIGARAAMYLSWTRRIAMLPLWVFIPFEVILLSGCIYLSRRADKPIYQIARQRIFWLRGGQGEALVAWYLNDLPKDFHVFHNIMVQTAADIDHVVIGPTGIFCLSTKSSRGQYSLASDGQYLLNGKETDHILQAQRLAMQLKDRLAGICGKIPWIQPVLIVPFVFIDFPTRQQKAWVVHEDNLPEVFTDGPIVLKAEDVERYAKAMDMIAEHAKEVFRREEANTIKR